MTFSKILVVRSDGEMRIVRKKPRLRWDEVAYTIKVTVPDAWGELRGIIELSLPGPPELEQVIENVVEGKA
jgi:hypothetical protein